jgi:polysaccharide biosynthesis protein VpsJ
MTPGLERAISRIRAWGESHDWRGYDPYDALNSPFTPYLTLGRPLAKRLLTQTVKLSPLNLRPALRVQPAWNAKALGLVASGYARLGKAADDATSGEHARRWLRWLVEHAERRERGAGWGYHFDVQTRFFGYARETPNTIATAFVAHAFLDGAELLEEREWLEGATAAADFLSGEMRVEGRDTTFFRYLPGEPELVHNANLLACGVLARTARALDNDAYREAAAAALATSLAAQRGDGSWPYAETPGRRWVDNFHTAYVLESLSHCVPSFPEVEEPLRRGIAYWHEALFLGDGTPKYFPESVYPLDAHSYASAIDAWVALSHFHPDAVANATRVANGLITTMLDPAGHVHFQKRRHWKNTVPFVRWTTAPSFRALAGLLLASRAQT